jgi:glycogen debranching enzyme
METKSSTVRQGDRRLPIVGKREGLQVVVGRNQSREYILTNKEKAYFAGETGTTNTRSYEGLIVELHKFLEGWDLFLGDVPLSSWGVKSACVLPQSMTREYVIGQTTETVFLADSENLLVLTYGTNSRGRAAFVPRVDIRSIWEEGKFEYESQWDADRRVLALRRTDHDARTEKDDFPVWVAIACDRPAFYVSEADHRPTTYTKDAARRAMASAVPFWPGRIEFSFTGDEAFASSVTFGIAVGDDLEETIALALRGVEDEFALYDEKMRRMSKVLDGIGVVTRDNDYRYALLWASSSVDSLVMNVMGRGIFAGLHWFPNYWGRDSFISLPGACLVRGEFGVAREVLETFADLQETCGDSLFYGRIPNLAMPGTRYYNTADGTWWFLRECYEYMRYSGDSDFARRVYPAVERAIEGALTKRVDSSGLLLHGEAETWMDAGGEAHPFSPRGSRAVEIQVLWITGLESGVALAELAGESSRVERWADAAGRARESFGRMFWDAERSALYDHLAPDSEPDRRIRPNQILALTVPWTDILSREREAGVLDQVRERCVLPHGVTSLDPDDPDFHPKHLDLERYHFDEAYHNGDVWVWLTGPVVSALVKHGHVEAAWEQTKVLRDLFFYEGAAGTLPELRNGVPQEGEENVAGAVSQAWSNAEFLRNFYQDYLGLQPDLLEGTLDFRPALPRDLSWVTAPIRLGTGSLVVFCEVDEAASRASYRVTASASLPSLTVRFGAKVPLDADVRTDVAEVEAILEPCHSLEFIVEEAHGSWSATAADVTRD